MLLVRVGGVTRALVKASMVRHLSAIVERCVTSRSRLAWLC